MPEGSNGALAAIHRRIEQAGRITFAEFMELALYHPDGGYYTRPGRISAAGDFYTSPSLHPAFGALIAIGLQSMWQRLDRPARFDVVELGAAAGLLARDVLRFTAHLRPEFAMALRYTPLDRAAGSLEEVGSPASVKEPVVGCVLSNELLDAFPVHRFEVRDGRIAEIYVALADGQLTEELAEPSTPELERALGPLAASLPEGYRGEVNLDVAPWSSQVRGLLARGFVLTVDFGYPRSQLYGPERSRGTLRCYHRHTLNANPYQHVGDQDLAAHVDFTAVSEALATKGFSPVALLEQGPFLDLLGFRDLFERLRREFVHSPELAPNRRAMLDLVQADGFGDFLVDVHATHSELGGALEELFEDAGNVARTVSLPLLDRDSERVDLLQNAAFQSNEFSLTWEELIPRD